MILTLGLDAASQANFDALRERYFPPERNVIAAHLTLFHQLPSNAATEAVLAAATQNQGGFRLQISGVRSLGRGVAYRLRSPVLDELHLQLARAFAADLIAQDKQRFDPHIVVQNKAEPAAAKALLAELIATFVPGEATAIGLDLWEYLGGPWRHARTFPFVAQESAGAT